MFAAWLASKITLAFPFTSFNHWLEFASCSFSDLKFCKFVFCHLVPFLPNAHNSRQDIGGGIVESLNVSSKDVIVLSSFRSTPTILSHNNVLQLLSHDGHCPHGFGKATVTPFSCWLLVHRNKYPTAAKRAPKRTEAQYHASIYVHS
jgi:hypothetical protein